MDAAHVMDAVQVLLASGVLAQGVAAIRWVFRVESRLADIERRQGTRREQVVV